MTVYLTSEQVVAINATIKGSQARCDDPAGIDAAVGRASSTFGGLDLLPTIWLKAASLLHGIASTQYFADGNKRTAFVAATLLLELNGAPLKPMEVVAREVLVLGAAVSLLSVEQVVEWLEVHALAADSRVFIDEDRTTIVGGTLHLMEFAHGASVLRNVHATDVRFLGPAVVTFLGRTALHSPFWEYGEQRESMLYERPPGTSIVGVTVFENSVFERCLFSDIGIAGTAGMLSDFRRESGDLGPIGFTL
ncbi:prophage maintenance system killer protein [Rathayibacter sp. PhB93]|uniref:type II toxin-antitoxin system death-on-curing family toxin n=1 Tax=unclassified Rathayibacter TaxID=2609250 RepID=UPI000F48F835|nr:MULTISPECIES: Fic family protein [unclassified Rathayibacter]ROQ05317.1 prophage maintenance system killer protein [Rathayibacter sp. PhB93]TDQ12612.1 prophage maintenance system killer protein [Rathayibacter sp. PhB1]